MSPVKQTKNDMKTEDVNRLALIYAIQAEIEGMKAANEYRRVIGDYPVYNQGDFDQMANQLETIVNKHYDEL